MSLTPIQIIACTDRSYRTAMKGRKYEAMINPESISLQRSISYNTTQTPNSSSASQKYKYTPSDKLNFDIVIDCTGIVNAKRITMKSETDLLEKTIFSYNGKLHRPNFVKIQWGEGIVFDGVLESFNTNYTLFKPDGSPLRAKVSLSFSLYISPKTVKIQDKKTSPDITHLVTVQQGMTLPQLCQEVWQNDTFYIQAARFNDLNKFRDLGKTEKLIFPPIIQPA